MYRNPGPSVKLRSMTPIEKSAIDKIRTWSIGRLQLTQPFMSFTPQKWVLVNFEFGHNVLMQ